eukprot:TRINITY_DN5471_c0_g2_i1.p2 TRINITY_DN5471_c0_g2~~TRINITY_DN5471_c0_g2_i1.p2  ORF type:complete len:150 (+),score=45.26 TRINITY_DN5471_c0_g2_i1:65-451(+)
MAAQHAKEEVEHKKKYAKVRAKEKEPFSHLTPEQIESLQFVSEHASDEQLGITDEDKAEYKKNMRQKKHQVEDAELVGNHSRDISDMMKNFPKDPSQLDEKQRSDMLKQAEMMVDMMKNFGGDNAKKP